MNGSFIGVSYARTVCENSNYLFLVFRCWSRFSSFILYRFKVNKLYSSQYLPTNTVTSTNLQYGANQLPYGTTYSGSNSVLIVPDVLIRKWLRPESKEESSMLGNIVSHLSMDSRCLSWWGTRKTGAGWVLKISKGKVTTSSINKIILLKKRKPVLLKEDERLLTSSEVSVSTGDSGQFKCENLIVWDYDLSWQRNVY